MNNKKYAYVLKGTPYDEITTFDTKEEAIKGAHDYLVSEDDILELIELNIKVLSIIKVGVIEEEV